MIDITLLGTSALLPTPERGLTAAHLRCGGVSILFDCGEGTQTAARRFGVSLMKADVIALTHYHGDHIFGLPGLMQTMHAMGRTLPLTITGPQGLEEALAPILRLTGATGYPIHLKRMPGEGMTFPAVPDAVLTAFPTKHRVPSQGYCFTLRRAGKFLPEKARELGVPVGLWSRLQKGEAVEADGCVFTPDMVLGAPRRGLKVAFTGDTAPCETLTEAARDADLLICEATYGEDEQAPLANEYGHMTFAQAGEAARDAQVKRLWLCHYSQMIEDPATYLPNARKMFPEAMCGEDGMRVRINYR